VSGFIDFSLEQCFFTFFSLQPACAEILLWGPLQQSNSNKIEIWKRNKV